MERKIDEIAATLEKWGTADNNRKYLLLAEDGEFVNTAFSCSLLEMIGMLGHLANNEPEFAYAVTFIAKLIDKLMQSEEVYQKLKEDKELSENNRAKMFIVYYKKAIAKREALIKKDIEEES
mgnify:FL=1